MDLKNFDSPPMTNFKVRACYQNEPRFTGVHSTDNLSDKIKCGANVVNLDEYSDIGLYCGIEHISKEMKKFVDNKNNSKHF